MGRTEDIPEPIPEALQKLRFMVDEEMRRDG